MKAFKSISSLDCLTPKACLCYSAKALDFAADIWKGMFVFPVWAKLPFNKTESTWYDVPSIYKCSGGPLNIKREQHKSLALSFIPCSSYF